MILGEHGENVGGVEAVEVVDEHRTLRQPLPVELAPHALGPAGVGDGEMQPVGIHAMPVFGGDEVAQGIFIIVHGRLGVAGGAGGEEHQHGIGAAGGVRFPQELLAEQAEFLVEAVPAVPLALHDDPDLQPGAGGQTFVHLVRHAAGGGAEDGPDVRCIDPVFDVVGQKLIGAQDGHGADLVQGHHADPELVVPPQDQQHLVPPLDAQGAEVVGRLVGIAADVREGEPAFLLEAVDVEHGQLRGVFAGHGVHHVEGEVEVLLVLEGDGFQAAVGPLHGHDEVFVNVALRRFGPLRGGLLPGGIRRGGHVDVLRRVQHHGVEDAVPAAHGHHAMGGGAVIINGIPFVEDLAVLAHLHLQGAGNDQVEFLALVGGEGDVALLQLRVVDGLGKKRVGDAVFEGGGHVVVHHAVGLLYALALALTGDGVGAELRAGAPDDVRDVHAEGQSAAVDEGKVQVALPALAGQVFLHGHARFLGDLLHAVPGDAPQFPDTGCHLLDLHCQTGHLLHATFLLPGDGKSPPQRLCNL